MRQSQYSWLAKVRFLAYVGMLSCIAGMVASVRADRVGWGGADPVLTTTTSSASQPASPAGAGYWNMWEYMTDVVLRDAPSLQQPLIELKYEVKKPEEGRGIVFNMGDEANWYVPNKQSAWFKAYGSDTREGAFASVYCAMQIEKGVKWQVNFHDVNSILQDAHEDFFLVANGSPVPAAAEVLNAERKKSPLEFFRWMSKQRKPQLKSSDPTTAAIAWSAVAARGFYGKGIRSVHESERLVVFVSVSTRSMWARDNKTLWGERARASVLSKKTGRLIASVESRVRIEADSARINDKAAAEEYVEKLSADSLEELISSIDEYEWPSDQK
jgi:hypothetical protein